MTNRDPRAPKNRSSLVFMAGLIGAATVAIWLDGVGNYMIGAGRGVILAADMEVLTPAPPRPLTNRDRDAAQTAWRYIAQNTRPTGLVDSVAGFPSTTLWDQGSYVLALASAQALNVIPEAEFHTRVDQFLGALADLPLFEGKLPNKAYHTETLAMVDYSNTAVPEGIGWSALDIARLLSGLRVLERRAPEFGPRIRAILGRWDLAAMAADGELTGATRENGETRYLQEGRIGYEQYGARASALWGLDVIPAMSAARIIDWRRAAGVDVPSDRRDHNSFGSITPTLSEPYMLQGLELGLDAESARLATAVYRAQEARFRREGHLTLVSEDHLDRAPRFVYNSVFSNGRPWAVVTESGEHHPDMRTVSLKAAFAWNALYDTDYTAQALAGLADLATDGGWYAGRYEASGELNDVLALNTNAVVLEAIHYKAFGPLWQIAAP